MTLTIVFLLLLLGCFTGFAAGLLGMVLMTVFAFILDSADPRANWIEQLTNGVAQAAFFM